MWANRYTPNSGWGTPERIQSDSGHAESPRVVMDAQGNALAVWRQSDGARNNIWANRYTAGIGWGTATLIETNDVNAVEPKVAFDAAGNALVVWRQDDIWFNRYVPGWGWGTAKLVKTNHPGGGSPQLAMHAGGDAVAVWVQEGIAWASHYTIGEGWSTPVPIGGGGSWTVFGPDVAMSSNGDALVVWHQYNGAKNDVLANRYTAGIGWGTPALLETNDEHAVEPKVTIDAAGNALAVWLQSQEGVFAIWSNHYTPEGGWGTAERIQSRVLGSSSRNTRIVGDAAGNALAVWQEGLEIYYNRYITGRGWGTSAPIGGGEGLAIVSGAGGNAMATWNTYNGATTDIYVNHFE